MKISLLFALVAAFSLDYRFTDQIPDAINHEVCRVFQSQALTLLQCPTNFAVYSTQDLALYPYSLYNSGEKGTIRYVRKSICEQNRLSYV
jgi:hypothetical protein